MVMIKKQNVFHPISCHNLITWLRKSSAAASFLDVYYIMVMQG